MRKSTTGFTIVELLIVIVVIAILAAISVVAYTGIQDRAYSSRFKADMNQITKAIQVHQAQAGTVPVCSSGSGQTCNLSTLNLPDTSSLPLPQRGTYSYVGTSADSNWAVRAYPNRTGTDQCKFGHFPNYTSWFGVPSC